MRKSLEAEGEEQRAPGTVPRGARWAHSTTCPPVSVCNESSEATETRMLASTVTSLPDLLTTCKWSLSQSRDLNRL